MMLAWTRPTILRWAGVSLLVAAGCDESTLSPTLDPAPCGDQPVDRDRASAGGAVVVCGSVVGIDGETTLVTSAVHYLDQPLRWPAASGFVPLALESDEGGLTPEEHLSLAAVVGDDRRLQVRLVAGGPAGTERTEHARIDCQPATSPSIEPLRYAGTNALLEVHAIRGSACTFTSRR